MFYSSIWDPRLIVGQIITIQCVFYLSLGGFLLAFDSLLGHSLTFTQIFSYKATSVHNTYGRITIFGTLFCSISGAFGLLYIVERSKKCLDHTATCWLVHIIGCWIYDGFPRGWTWWIVNATCLVFMAVMGEYLCMRREMLEIPLTRPLGSRSTNYSPFSNSIRMNDSDNPSLLIEIEKSDKTAFSLPSPKETILQSTKQQQKESLHA
eukprot:TRINITY_DN2057_c0_g1_i1.p1 TRINITY_DN2057_c0_g1~~TRINITY_DN2057_c0_g1_i1.p1  ORF type:complete len:208 (+),score=24.12 TRINITY_DN2057_c0_g1_i1:160-783(+)